MTNSVDLENLNIKLNTGFKGFIWAVRIGLWEYFDGVGGDMTTWQENYGLSTFFFKAILVKYGLSTCGSFTIDIIIDSK